MGGMLLRENEQQAYGWEERPLYAAIWFNKFEDKFYVIFYHVYSNV